MIDASSYLQAFITVGGAIMGLWGFYKVVSDIKNKNDNEVVHKQKIDNAVKIVEEKSQAWDQGLADIDNMREQMMDKYDGRLDNQDAKTQQLYAMQCMSLRAQDAILQALVEQGIGNGEIRSIHKELRDFILEQVS